jgi:Flp pilus assembly pilin Flp
MLEWTRLVRRWYADEAGAELAEWAVLTVVMVGGSLAAMIALRKELGELFTRLIGQYLH